LTHGKKALCECQQAYSRARRDKPLVLRQISQGSPQHGGFT
jgi:hypothetical protein